MVRIQNRCKLDRDMLHQNSIADRGGSDVKVESVARCFLQMRETKSLGSHENSLRPKSEKKFLTWDRCPAAAAW